MNEVEDALVAHLGQHILTESVVEMVLREIKREVQAQMPERELDMSALEAELETTRMEQRKLAKAVALADDIPELVTELKQRSARIRHLEAQFEAAQRTPEEVAKVMKRVEVSTRRKLGDIRAALSERSDLRQVFLALFPDGLTFHPEWAQAKTGRRRV